MKSINDEAYFGVNPADPFSSLTDEGREKAMDYINLLHASGMYEKQTAKIIPFRSIDIFENAVSAGTGNFLVDRPKETVCIDESILPEDTTFGVRISGDSMEPDEITANVVVTSINCGLFSLFPDYSGKIFLPSPHLYFQNLKV